MTRSFGYNLLRGNLLVAIPQMIRKFERGWFSQSRIAKRAGIDPRTLRGALRQGEQAESGLLRDLHLAELASRGKRPWGCRAGPGKPFPKQSAPSSGRRGGRWAELWDMPTPQGDEDPGSAPWAARAHATQPAALREQDFADLLKPDAKRSKQDNSNLNNLAAQAVNHAADKPSGLFPSKRTRGRARIVSPAMVEGIAIAIQYGSSRRDIAAGYGLHPRTIAKWLARGKREPESVYGAFYRRVLEARRVRSKPGRLVTIQHACKAAVQKKYPELTLSELEELRKRSAVLFGGGSTGQQLVELRWPKPGRKLTDLQRQLFTDGLQVVGWDIDGRPRSIILVAHPAARRRERRPRPEAKGLHAAPGEGGTMVGKG